MAGLDGLRAVAVLLVVAYHFAPRALPGGYVGVDIFFVLSGFLITSILLKERAERGAISLRRFWLHRARRLVPALAALVAVCVAAVAIGVVYLQLRGQPVNGSPWGDLLVGVGAQIAAAATFTSNWLTVAVGQSYAAAGSPHLFGNLWSLAVEEQFYLLWPLAVLGVFTLGMAMRRAAAAAATLALASAVAMALLLPVDGDPTRVYVGTDTHAFGLMIGAALAFWWRHRQDRPEPSRRVARAGIAAGGAGLVAIALIAGFMPWDAPWTYRGGLLLASIATAAVILAVVEAPRLGGLLDAGPMRWIGERSYGIYLWHWPVFVILATGFDGGRIRMVSGATVVLASIVTVIAATISYRWLELPVRREGFRRSARRLVDWLYPVSDTREVIQAARRRRAGLFGGTVAAVIALAGSAVAAAPAKTSLELQLEEGARSVEASVPAAEAPTEQAPPAATSAPVSPAVPVVPAVEASAAPEPSPTATEAQAAPAALPSGSAVMMVGDSVTLGSAGALTDAMPGLRVEAAVGKQFSVGVDRIDWLARNDRLRPYVVLALGTNGTVRDADIDRLMATVGDRPVVLVTPYGDRSWMPGAQKAIRAAAERYDTVVIADWQRVVEADTSILGPDGIHPRASGVDLFVGVVERGLRDAAALDVG
nr:acyltransferase family protein [Demequina sp.]